MNFFFSLIALFFISSSAHALLELPASYTNLNQFVITAPYQGDTGTCLFVASTGAMEILLSRKLGIINPKQWGASDLSERYLIAKSYRTYPAARYWFENVFMIFNSGEAVLASDMPFESYTKNGDINYAVWNTPANFETAPRIKVPKVDTVLLFSVGGAYSRNVLNESHVLKVKEALVKYQSPILTLGNDEEYWHLNIITGYDDEATDGDCYELDSEICKGKKGAFYVRDSYGYGLEKRSYEWFIRRQNSATVAKLADE